LIDERFEALDERVDAVHNAFLLAVENQECHLCPPSQDNIFFSFSLSVGSKLIYR
jgi:hypothetical protein